MPIRRTASLQTVTQPEQSRSLADKRQVVNVDPVKWAAIVEAGTRVGSALTRNKRSDGSLNVSFPSIGGQCAKGMKGSICATIVPFERYNCPVSGGSSTSCCRLRASHCGPSDVAAFDFRRSVHRRVRGDVCCFADLLPAYPRPCAADRRAADTRLHCPARLRARLFLRLATRQCPRRETVQPLHAHALRQLEPPAQRASRRLE